MRVLLALIFYVAGFLAAPAALGLTPKECQDMRTVYGSALAGCGAVTAQATTVSLSPAGAAHPTIQQMEDHVFFPQGGSALDGKALAQIDLLSQLLNGQLLGSACLALVGHSDTSGGEAANMKVAKARAETVGTALQERLDRPARVEKILAAGESMPLENIAPQSRWQRRVEIRARRCDD
jgi:outer membrane protein OmpA-like peptidoglycan-associated protein